MNMALCSSTTSELACHCVVGLRGKNGSLYECKPFVRVRESYSRKSHIQVTGQLMRGHLEGSSMGKKHLEEPSRKLEFVRTLLIDNYDSYTYNIYQELSTVNGLPPVVVRNDEWTWRDICRYLYEEIAFDNIVISPGPGSPACPGDIGICLQLLLECWDVPILGVCLGHQALGYVHGAKIVHAPEPVHGRLSEIEHNGCRLFHDIPSGQNSGFKVVRYHSLVIDSDSLPKELIPIAWTNSDNNLPYFENLKFDVIPDACGSQTRKTILVDGTTQLKNGHFQSSIHSNGRQSKNVIMGIMHSTRPHYGVQFHPESIATCHGSKIFRNFRDITEDYWLRSRSSSIKERNAHYTACMQAPLSSQLFREIPRIRQSVNHSVELYKQAAPHGEVTFGAEKSSFGMFNMVNFQHPSSGIKFLKLKWRKFDRLASQVGGAKNVFCKLFGDKKAENTFWLDSSSIEKGRARFSLMGGKGGSLWKQVTFRLSDSRSG